MKIICKDIFFDYISDKYINSVQLRISQGCGEDCSFCRIPIKEGREVQFTPYQELKEGIIQLWEEGIRHLYFLDDTFLLYGAVIEKIFKELSKEGIGVSFSFVSTVKNVIKNQKHLTPFKALGLRSVTLRIENSNQDVLKRYRINSTLMDQEYAIQILQALRIQVQLNYSLFEPLTNIEHLTNDLKFLEKNKLWGLVPYSDILTSYLNIEENTPLGKDYHNSQLYLPSSDSDLPYQIIQKEAEEVFKWMLYFKREFGERWNHLYQHMIDLRVKLAEKNSGWIVSITGQELMYLTLSLRLIPYDFMKALISAVQCHGVGRITEREIRRQCEWRFVDIEETYKEFDEKLK